MKTLTPDNNVETLHIHQTRIDLPEKTREQMIETLNNSLSHLIDLYLQVKQAHWNVKGMRFIALHELFDLLARELLPDIDTVAERATTLGGVANGIASTVCDKSTLTPYPLNIVTGEDHVKALIERYAHLCKIIRDGIDQADKKEDRGTADLFTEISRRLDLRLWFLEAHLQDKMPTK